MIWKTNLSKQPCAYIEKIINQKTKDPDKENPSSDDLARYFRCGFRTTFSGVLKRAFDGISSIKNYEVTFIREHECGIDDFENCSAYANVFIVEFNFQIDVNYKIQNGRTVKESINEAMNTLRKETSLIIKPKKPDVANGTELAMERRNDKNAENTERVRFLKRPEKIKMFGQFVIPFVVGTLIILFLLYL